MDLNLAAVFVRVVEAGSFTAAAAALGLPKSSVSRAVARLEAELGVRLLQKTGSETPLPYRARLFLRQTFDLGGERVPRPSQPLLLGSTIGSRRLVLTLGNFSALDVFDKNNVTWDPRQTFFDEAFMTHSSWDFPADARGYTVGATAELYWDDWVVRAGHLAPPQNPNGLPLDLRFWRYYGDTVEVEHDHVLFGQAGAVRLLGYRNHVFSGRFDDAINAFLADPRKNAGDCPRTSYNYGSRNFTAPDFCWCARPTSSSASASTSSNTSPRTSGSSSAR